MMHRGISCALAFVLVAGFGTPSFAADEALLCQTSKLKRAGKYSFCRLKAEAKGVKKGEAPDYSKCDLQFTEKWNEAESAAAGACPTNDDAVAMLGLLASDADILAAAVSGNPIPNPSFPASGQITCWSVAGAVVSCAGTGQDGQAQAGASLAYIDNGDGTLTDLNTGLTWEIKTDDGTVNDKDRTYTFEEAVTLHVAELNTAQLGGFADWRVPNIKELQSLVNYETNAAAVSVALLHDCTFHCTSDTCSCTSASFYWSSTSQQLTPTSAWGVDFGQGFTSRTTKTTKFYVRGVRGGL